MILTLAEKPGLFYWMLRDRRSIRYPPQLENDLMSQQLDPIDTIATKAFEGYVVRKDLVRKFKGQYPVPTYVAEFLLGRYCASVEDEEISEGLKIVERQLSEKTIRAGEHELFKARAKNKGQVKLIDIITARLDAGTDSFLAIESLREIQLSKREVLPALYQGRGALATAEGKNFLIRSIGMEPEQLTPRARDMMLLRMVPFVERNYNMVELGPRGTGKSHLFQQISPYAHLVSGGKATVASMFVNNANGRRGLGCQYDVVCFDEISGVSFDQKDGVNIMKGYMESGEFSRGRESIRAEGSIAMVGNFDVDVEHQQRSGHLVGPIPPEMRNDTALMDRIHAYLPGWDLPKMSASLF